MKKLLQFVALLLAFCISSQPVLADTACAQRACGSHPSMDCCPPASTAMSMGMSCGQSHPAATAPMHCIGDICCIVSAPIIPAIPSPRLLSPVAASVQILPATVWIPSNLSAIKPPPNPRPLLPTPRYILFRDFRI
jgi:hypothetical protein